MVLETLPALKTSELNLKEAVHVLRRVFPIELTENFVIGTQSRVIGREPPSQGIKLDDVEASRAHAQISKIGSKVLLEDLRSTNGTLVNDERVTVQHLKPNDVVQVGRTLFVYCRLELGLSAVSELNEHTTSLSRLVFEQLAKRAAISRLPILINGPTGSGKERLAELVHHCSKRDGNFVPINCGAMPSELISSELFGHLKGSFSGASDHRQGLFQTADGGTLFLDEIAELPLAVQATLLRVCETNEIRPVGSDQVRKVDVRLVSATHADLDERVAAGLFRADLLARLRGVMCTVPALRDRRDEVLRLFSEFAKGRAFGLTVAKQVLLAIWSENVRGLRRAAEHALLFADEGSQVLPHHLPALEFAPKPDVDFETVQEDAPNDLSRLLAETRGNVAEVARRLGVHRQQVYRWMSKAKLKPSDFRN
jgi:DNA-binding NtrC family response regulator